MSKNYEQYLEEWLSGLQEEIEFWKDYMETQGDIYADSFEKTVEKNKRFTLEEDLPFNDGQKKVSFIDVGSGPFSRCGNKTDKIELNVTAVDPLAEVYNFLKTENLLENGIHIETGFVELLDHKFGKNTFDIVHMSNSLDHSFDAIYGIYQLLYICKVGGKVILRHTENEALRSEYQGLHQWNLSLHNEEKSFVIWRDGIRYDVCKLFAEYADFELFPDVWEGNDWKYNKVVMVKKKDVTIPENLYYEQMLEKVYSYLLKMLLNIVYSKPSRKEVIIQNRMVLSKIANHEIDIHRLQECMNDQKQIDIYGLGVVGKAFIDLLMEYGIQIGNIIDRDSKEYKGMRTVQLDELHSKEKQNCVMIAVMRDTDEIVSQLKEKGYNPENILSMKDLL